MIVRFIGDVHGHLDRYLELINSREYPCDMTVCLGEIGFGSYVRKYVKWLEQGVIDPRRNIIVPGNHDDYSVINDIPTFLTSPGYGELISWIDVPRIFYVRGAYSHPNWKLQEGLNYFPEDEELKIPQLNDALEYYSIVRPTIMVTHTAPHCLKDQLLDPSKSIDKTRTDQALQAMLEYYCPKIWFFGHFHKTGVFKVPGCRTNFVGLGELATCDLNTEDMSIEVRPTPEVGWGDFSHHRTRIESDIEYRDPDPGCCPHNDIPEICCGKTNADS